MPVIKYQKRPEPESSRTMQVLKILAVIVVVLAGALLWQQIEHSSSSEIDNSAGIGEVLTGVTSVHDGDTFRIGYERVRIIGLDAPEIGKRANCANEQSMAKKAQARLRNALSSGNVRIARDGRDAYGRTLARIYVDGADVAPVMIAEGLAKPYVVGRHGNWCN